MFGLNLSDLQPEAEWTCDFPPDQQVAFLTQKLHERNSQLAAMRDRCRSAEQELAARHEVVTATQLSRRELFSAMAMQGMIAGRRSDDHSDNRRGMNMLRCVQYADDLIYALENTATKAEAAKAGHTSDN